MAELGLELDTLTSELMYLSTTLNLHRKKTTKFSHVVRVLLGALL